MREGLRKRKRRRQVIGETAVWSSIVGLVGHAAFGLPGGLALALGFGTAHVRVRRRERDGPRPVVGAWHLVGLPAVLGIALVAMPILLLIVGALALLGFWLATPLPVWLGPRRRARWAGFAVAAATVWLCAVFPKHLDCRVGPAHYDDVSLGELRTRLRKDHRLRHRPRLTDRTPRLRHPAPDDASRSAAETGRRDRPAPSAQRLRYGRDAALGFVHHRAPEPEARSAVSSARRYVRSASPRVGAVPGSDPVHRRPPHGRHEAGRDQ